VAVPVAVLFGTAGPNQGHAAGRAGAAIAAYTADAAAGGGITDCAAIFSGDTPVSEKPAIKSKSVWKYLDLDCTAIFISVSVIAK
jgi:hypothetical protein